MHSATPTWAKATALAVLGGSLGFLMSAAQTRACDCIGGPLWRVRLREVTSSDPGIAHRPYWGENGHLSIYKRDVTLQTETRMSNGVASASVAR